MQDELIARGIVPYTLEWPERAKNWFYAHGGRLNLKDGSIVFGNEIREAATRLDDFMKKNCQWILRKGLIQWKYAFCEYIESYRSHQRSKVDQARQLIEEIIDKRVAIALSKHASQQTTATASGPHWPKRYIRITQPNPPTLGASPQGSRARSPTPFTRAPSPLPDRSPSISPVVERDPSMSPTPPPTKKHEESKAAVAAEHEKWQQGCKEAWLKKQNPKPPLDKCKLRYFIRRMEAEQRKKIEKPPLLDYDRQITKQTTHKRKKSRKSVSQLEEQSNQLVAPLVVLSDFDKNLVEFAKDTNLIVAQLRGKDDIPTLPVPDKWQYEYGQELVRPILVNHLPTKMYKLHQWYMQAASNGYAVMEVRISHEHYFHGDDIVQMPLEELFQLYNQEALDKSLISCWVLIEMQYYCRMGYHEVSFMDPSIIFQDNLRDKQKQTLKNIFKFLDKHRDKRRILLPWNFEYHWVLIIIIPDQSLVIVWDSLRKSKGKIDDIMNALNKCWTQLRQTHKGDFKEQLDLHTDFPCVRQQEGTHLCGYYVCDFIHEFMMNKKEKLLDTEVFKAIQDQLCGFLLDEVTNPTGEFHNSGSNLVHKADSGSD
uniref:Ubiquitin-like protease family profile domain-containing protein n=1 Tax=Setaria viridis TaxID=4556 RepID=A0A4V6DA61_SETVI|nr:hypothetical protein SEVIR_3G314500v2 [Setaria viridis]